jgi:hypothetical protein
MTMIIVNVISVTSCALPDTNEGRLLRKRHLMHTSTKQPASLNEFPLKR